MGDLRIGIGAPRDHQAGNRLTSLEQGIGQQDAGHGIGRVGKLVGRAAVSGSIDTGIAGLQPVIDRNAAAVVPDAGSLQPQPFDVGRPSHPHQNLVDGHRSALAVLLQDQQLVAALLLNRNDLDPKLQAHTFPDKGLVQNPGSVGIFTPEDMVS